MSSSRGSAPAPQFRAFGAGVELFSGLSPHLRWANVPAYSPCAASEGLPARLTVLFHLLIALQGRGMPRPYGYPYNQTQLNGQARSLQQAKPFVGNRLACSAARKQAEATVFASAAFTAQSAKRALPPREPWHPPCHGGKVKTTPTKNQPRAKGAEPGSRGAAPC